VLLLLLMVLLLGTKFDKILDVFFLLSHVLLFMQFPLFFSFILILSCSYHL